MSVGQTTFSGPRTWFLHLSTVVMTLRTTVLTCDLLCISAALACCTEHSSVQRRPCWGTWSYQHHACMSQHLRCWTAVQSCLQSSCGRFAGGHLREVCGPGARAEQAAHRLQLPRHLHPLGNGPGREVRALSRAAGFMCDITGARAASRELDAPCIVLRLLQLSGMAMCRAWTVLEHLCPEWDTFESQGLAAWQLCYVYFGTLISPVISRLRSPPKSFLFFLCSCSCTLAADTSAEQAAGTGCRCTSSSRRGRSECWWPPT